MIEFHPLANLFPLIEGREFDELVADIGENGLLEPIVLLDGKILDGRNRYRAAVAAGVISARDPAQIQYAWDRGMGVIGFEPFDGDGDPLAWVLSKNLHRRHLTENQRTMIAAEIATMRQGRPSEWDKNRDDKSANRPDLSQAEAAEMLSVSERNVRRGRAVLDHGAPELVDAVKRDEIAVSAAAEVAKLPASEQLDIIRSMPPHLVAKAARERVGQGGRATQASRVEPSDSLDFYPTPPWGTRALIEDVLTVPREQLAGLTAWDPACGEGHMTGVLEEYFGTVIGTDIHDYARDGRSSPAWGGVMDFLGEDRSPEDLADGQDIDWIITNPPFSGEVDRALAFALRALPIARQGVALFVRTQWLEGITRYNKLFSVTPPTVVAQFAERISLFRGEWDPDGSKPDQYCWLVWVKGDLSPCGFEWIRPGRCAERTLDSDEARFTAHPAMSTPVDMLAVAPDGAAAAGEGGPVGASGALPQTRRLTRSEAEPILIERYATTDVAVLQREFGGVPINTIRSWAFKLGLTDVKRRATQLAERNRSRKQGEAAHG